MRSALYRASPILFGLAMAVLWEVLGRRSNPILLPPLSRVLQALWGFATADALQQAWFSSTRLLLMGLGLGTIVGIVGGLVLGRFQSVEEILDPFLAAAFATPRIALLPLIILWFGIGLQAQVFMVFLTSFFEVLVATVVGVRTVGRGYVEVARAFRLPRRLLITGVLLPGAVPHIVSGLRLATGHALIGVVLAEMFIQATGIGGLILSESQNFRTAGLLAAVLTVAGVAVILNALLNQVERRYAPWKASPVTG